MMNKALEVIEAHYLFGVAYDRIDVVVHPQSIVHSLVEMVDGSVKAQLGEPDMRVPIQYAITAPDRARASITPLDLAGRRLTFDAPDGDAFPCLALGYEAGRRGGVAPAVLNAADEVAVGAFLERPACPSSTSQPSSKNASTPPRIPIPKRWRTSSQRIAMPELSLPKRSPVDRDGGATRRHQMVDRAWVVAIPSE